VSVTPPLPVAASGLLEALLIGLIIGAQREAQKESSQAGLRDFLLIALTGGICGLIGQIALTIAALAAIVVFLSVYYVRADRREGITTEMAAVATYVIAVLAATPGESGSSQLAVGAGVVIVVLLEAKRWLHRLVRETITETEFNDTIWFLAIIFIIYPLLPEGAFGPYDAFRPRQIWLFVILVSSISYVGYFLQRFLGPRRGLLLTSVLGGLASTTATTLAFAREVRDKPEAIDTYWSSTVVANAIQFPRIVLILYVVNRELALAAAVVLLAMTAVGLAIGLLLYRRAGAFVHRQEGSTGNPFRLAPALKFGAIFAAIMFLSEMASAEFGGQGLYFASAIGGAVDADAVTVSAASLQGSGSVGIGVATGVILLALLMNGLLKTSLAAYAAGMKFGWRVAVGFVIMFGVGGLTLFIRGGF
jgi:uncharacterized membrane protein (DUF4010 family)